MRIRELTPREREIYRLIGRGKTSKEIAAALNLSVQTVANHRKNICSKLGVHSTAELVASAAGRLRPRGSRGSRPARERRPG